MNTFLNLGKYLYAIPFAVFGLFHFMSADAMAGMAFGQTWLVYLTGLALIAATISIILGKMDKLATVLLALFLILTAVLIHAGPGFEGNQGSMGNFLKDLALAGAAMMYASSMAKDDSVIG